MYSSRGAYGSLGVPNYGHTSGIHAYLNQQKGVYAQNRAHEINMREMQYMAAQQALGLGQYGQGNANAGMNQWLNQWNTTLQESKGVYNQALQSYGDTYEWMTSAKESANRLGGLAEQLQGDYSKFREEFAGTEEAFRLEAQEELQARGLARQELMGQMEADYEGVAGQAMSDVTSQGEMARESEARRMQKLGIDPSTKQGQAMMQRISGQEATGKAMAATQARRGEKERVTGASAMAMQLLDPSKMAQTAVGIRGAGNQMLGMAANLYGQQTSALSGLAGTQAQIAQGQANIGGSMAQNIAGQYGNMGGLQMGLQYGGQYGAQQNSGNPYLSMYTQN